MDESNSHPAPGSNDQYENKILPSPSEPGAEMDALLAGAPIEDVKMSDTAPGANKESYQLFCSDDEDVGLGENASGAEHPRDDDKSSPTLRDADMQDTDVKAQRDQSLTALFCSNDIPADGETANTQLPVPWEGLGEPEELLAGVTNTTATQESSSTACQPFPSINGGSGSSEAYEAVQQPGAAGDKRNTTKKKAQPKQSRKPHRAITNREKKANATIAFENSKYGRKRKSNAAGVRQREGKNPTKREKKKQNQRPNVNLDSLLSCSDAIAAAKATASRPAAPGFTVKDKRKALKEIIDNVSGLSRRAAAIDRRSIFDSIDRFNKKPRANGQSGWLHPDMTTGLYHYQLVGAGFMRERENSRIAPYGGLLCDQMGFGKTIQAIANIVDGQAEPGEKRKATLIVAPSHLVTHWKREINDHVKKGALGTVLTYHPAHRPDDDLLQDLIDGEMLGVLITSYAEVRRSYPDLEQPIGSNNEDEAQIRADRFYESAGILHRIPFRRIVLDAHEVKNPKSRASIAVRTLVARFRWIITGTPAHNGLEEFYSYFEFLKVPHIGSFEKFNKDYCPDDSVDRTRLTQALSLYMLRRTFGDEMFGHPILSLPDVNEQTVTVTFSKAERYLYRELTVRCVQELFDIANKTREKNRVFKSYLVLLLRLRMFTSHLLSCHQTLKKIVTPEIVRDLRAAITEDGEPEDLETCYLVENLVAGQKLPSSEELHHVNSTDKRREPVPYTPRQRSIVTLFRAKLNRAESAENESDVSELLACRKCKESPFDAYITTCTHVLCHACFKRLKSENCELKCECGTVFQDLRDVAFYRAVESLRDSIPTRMPEDEAETIAPRLATASDIDEGEIDWVKGAGHLMQGAKLKAIRGCVVDWFKKTPDAKVIIFTQFLDMVRILVRLCEQEDWGCVTLTGKSSPIARDRNIEQFRDDARTSIMISSLKAGGTGLNLTMATRCILVDLWWNEAVEQQAFFRMYRIGQTKDVQFVKLTVQDTVDDRLQSIQDYKTGSIDQVMCSDVLSPRETLMNVLQICGLREDENAESGLVFTSDQEDGPAEN